MIAKTKFVVKNALLTFTSTFSILTYAGVNPKSIRGNNIVWIAIRIAKIPKDWGAIRRPKTASVEKLITTILICVNNEYDSLENKIRFICITN